MKRLYLTVLCLLWLASFASAQEFDAPRTSARIFGISSVQGTVTLGEHAPFPLPAETSDIAWHPDDSRRWARAGQFGLLRFVDPNNPTIAEGVYTFPPFFDGYASEDPSTNKLFVRDVEWSPDGQQLAFYMRNDLQPDLNQGVWFYQPVRELATDPSYQLLRPCPQYCSAAGLPGDYAGWDVLGIEWAPDSGSVLVEVSANEFGGRRALTIRAAARIDPPPATIAPNFLQFDYGHWGVDERTLIVSGLGETGEIGFGTVSIPAFITQFTPASEIGLTWVQDAVQEPESGTLLMLGNQAGFGFPLQIVTQEGDPLTPLIDIVPDHVEWSPDRSAVLLQNAEQTIVATVSGTVYDLSETTDNSPAIDWVGASLPADFTALPLPEPIAEGEVTPEADVESAESEDETVIITDDGRTIVIAPQATSPAAVDTAAPPPAATAGTFAVGTLLRHTGTDLAVFDQPVNDATRIGSIAPNEELIVTGGPLDAGDAIWYRVQTLSLSGWINDWSELVVPQD